VRTMRIALSSLGVAGAAIAAFAFSTSTGNAAEVANPAAGNAVSPAITVASSGPLADGQRVSVSGSGFTSGAQLTVLECAVIKGEAICNFGDSLAVKTATGSSTVSLTAHRTFDAAGFGKVDCATADGGCIIAVASDADNYAYSAITFK